MDSRTAKRISEELGYAARYEPKIKVWQITKAGSPGLTLTTKQVDKMTPDQLRKKLGAQPPPEKKIAKPKAVAFDTAATITLLVAENPKRPGTATHKMFALYKTGVTVGELCKHGVSPNSMRWDVEHKFIAIG